MEHYFPAFCTGADSTFADDYAAIGAFLTRNDEVLRKLIPLENKLRALALDNVSVLQKRGQAPNVTGMKTIYDTKDVTSKILTRALQDVETQAGFNVAKAGLLHDSSAIGVGAAEQVDMRHTGRTTGGVRKGATDANLPAGVPKIIGAIKPMDFMVLLKHGYAFKDVGAESAHGEFTHRLQWYAIIQAKGELSLTNSPIDLYKKMWFKSTLGTQNLTQNFTLYMWVALLDNLSKKAEADNLKTMAWTVKTFNSPEDMNTHLTRKIYGQEGALNENDSSNLYVLRKILQTRQGKRALGGYDGTEKYHAKKMIPTTGSKTILAGGTNEGTANLSDLKNAVVWIESL